jgi:hypothetical protein
MYFILPFALLFIAWRVIRAARRRRYGHGYRRRIGLSRVFDVLDTTPDQEKVIREAVDELRNEARNNRGEWRESQTDLAELLKNPSFDPDTLERAFHRHDQALARFRVGLSSALARVHEALSDTQRERLAAYLTTGLPRSVRRGFAGGGVYR